MYTRTLLVLAWLGPLATAAQGVVGSIAPAFKLGDQFDRQTTLQFPQNEVVVLIFADRSGLGMAQNWILVFTKSFPVAQLVPVACTGWVPFFVQPIVRKAFKEQKPILIDWNDIVAKQYGYTGRFWLVVINPAGQILAVEKADYSPARFAALTRTLH